MTEKDKTIISIKNRILSEYNKHSAHLDWAEIAARKIYSAYLKNDLLPDLDIDQAEELAWATDYACFAIEEDGTEINKADAGAFFLEGYIEAQKRLKQ